MNIPADNLSNDLRKILDWVIEWKMSFKPDTSKQVQEVIFSRKQNSNHDLTYIF